MLSTDKVISSSTKLVVKCTTVKSERFLLHYSHVWKAMSNSNIKHNDSSIFLTQTFDKLEHNEGLVFFELV